MYKVIGRLEDRGKLVGFRCLRDSDNRILDISKRDINRLIADNRINISKDRRGYYFIDSKHYMYDLPVIKVKKKDIRVPREYRIASGYNKTAWLKDTKGKRVLTGSLLEEHIKNVVYEKEVYKIYKLKEFLDRQQGSEQICFIVTGMKRTGKTAVMNQGIRYLLNNGVSSKDIVSINYQSEYMDTEIDKLIEFMEDTSCKYIFIDEITLLYNFADRSKVITDGIADTGKKVVLSGSDTLAFTLAERKWLLNRCIKMSTTFTDYKDWCNITKNISGKEMGIEEKKSLIKQYIANSALNDYGIYKSNTDMYNYVLDTIALNTINSLKRNKNAGRIECLEGISDINLTDLFYTICYDVIHYYTREISNRGISLRRNIEVLMRYVYGKSDKTAIQDIKNKVLAQFGIRYTDGIDSGINIDRYNSILGLMVTAGLLVNCTRYSRVDKEEATSYEEREYYLTVPSIYNRFIVSMYKAIKGSYADNEDIMNKQMNESYGLVLEAIVMTHIQQYIKYTVKGDEGDVGKIRVDNNQEIDILVDSENVSGLGGCAYDVKMSDKISNKHIERFKGWFSLRFRSIIETGNVGIIYMGETTEYKGYQYINVHDFLMDIGKYIGHTGEETDRLIGLSI